MQASTSAAGIAKMYTHFGRPSKLLSSLVRISISSFIVLLYLVVNNVRLFLCDLIAKIKTPRTSRRAGGIMKILQKTKISRLTAKEDVLQAQSALLPSLSASTNQNVAYRPWVASGMSTVANGYVQSSVDKVYYNGNYGVNANWTVWNGNQNRNTVKLNKLAEEQAELDSAVTANSIQEQIAQLYVQILYSDEAIKVNRQSLETSKKNEERGQEMVNVGKMSKADLAQLTAQRAQDEYNIVAAESNLKNYKRQLRQLLQITDGEEFDVVIPTTTDEQALAEIPSMASVYNLALLNRPEIRNSKLAIESSELNMKIAKAGSLPTIGLNASAGTLTLAALYFS